MKARLRIIVAALVGPLLAGAPALAQDSETAPPTQNATIGPPQLRDFSLNGTVTREAPAPAEAAPPQREQPRRQPAEQVAEPQRRESSPQSAPRVAEQARERAPGEVRDSAEGRTSILPQLGPLPESGTAVAVQPDLDTPPPAAAAIADSPGSGLSILPWLAAALVLGGAAAWFFTRQRPRPGYAGVGAVNQFDSAPDTPAPRPAPAPAKPEPIPAQPSGVVSTRLRPWLEIEFEPLRAVVDEQKAAVAFQLSVFNSGSVPARNVLLEASLFNAGPEQDRQIQLFFDNPVAKGDRVPVIPPMQRMSVETAVFLQRDQVRPIEIEGRSLFVPMIAFNVLYSWGRSEGQTSSSYLVGKQTDGEKLAPFRLDLGSRIFRKLAAREHELRLRK